MDLQKPVGDVMETTSMVHGFHCQIYSLDNVDLTGDFLKKALYVLIW